MYCAGEGGGVGDWVFSIAGEKFRRGKGGDRGGGDEKRPISWLAGGTEVLHMGRVQVGLVVGKLEGRQRKRACRGLDDEAGFGILVGPAKWPPGERNSVFVRGLERPLLCCRAQFPACVENVGWRADR